jgi:hypothetical protein
VYAYQNTVLAGNQEVEDGLVNYFKSHQEAQLLEEGVVAYTDAVAYMTLRKGAGVIDGNAWAVVAQNLVTQEVAWAKVYGNIPTGLITVYRALGGGWEIRLNEESPVPGALPGAAKPKEEVPLPAPPPVPAKSEQPLTVPQPIPDRPRARIPAAPSELGAPETPAKPAAPAAPVMPDGNP